MMACTCNVALSLGCGVPESIFRGNLQECKDKHSNESCWCSGVGPAGMRRYLFPAVGHAWMNAVSDPSSLSLAVAPLCTYSHFSWIQFLVYSQHFVLAMLTNRCVAKQLRTVFVRWHVPRKSWATRLGQNKLERLRITDDIRIHRKWACLISSIRCIYVEDTRSKKLYDWRLSLRGLGIASDWESR